MSIRSIAYKSLNRATRRECLIELVRFARVGDTHGDLGNRDTGLNNNNIFD